MVLQILRFSIIAVVLIFLTPAGFAESKRQKKFLGIGTGISAVRKSALGKKMMDTGIDINSKLGFGLNRKLALVLDFGLHHLNDDKPRITDLVVIPPSRIEEELRVPQVFKTAHLFLSLKINLKDGFYLQPGLGVGRHWFAVYSLDFDRVTRAGTSGETGYSAGFSAGYEHRLNEKTGISLEGIYVGSTGEDSSSGRRILGLQVTGLVYF